MVSRTQLKKNIIKILIYPTGELKEINLDHIYEFKSIENVFFAFSTIFYNIFLILLLFLHIDIL